MSGVCWIHLSDWHQSSATFDRRKLRDALVSDIKRRTKTHDSLERIHFIVFSGDVAAHGKAFEYESAKAELFEPVVEAAGWNDDKSNLFIVPGNHDINWDSFELDPANLLEKMTDLEVADKWLADPTKRETLLRPFSDYSDFITKYLGEHQDFYSQSPAYAYTRNVRVGSKQISIVCINSSWLAGRHKDHRGNVKDYGSLIVGESQLHDALDATRNADLKIAVMHHPVNWLAERESIRIEERLNREFDFVLVGHQHYPQVRVDFSTTGDVIVIPAGACYDRQSKNGARYANTYSYNYLDLESGEGSVFIKRWSDRQNAWIPDSESVQNGRFDYTLRRLSPLNLQVSVAIIIHEGRVLLVRRREQEGKLRWQFPGGVVRGDQADKDVAEREAFEETNIKCRAVRKVGQRVHPDTKALVHYWLCQYIEGKEVLRDTKDLAEVRWVTPKNAFELITSDIYPHLKKVLRAEAKVK